MKPEVPTSGTPIIPRQQGEDDEVLENVYAAMKEAGQESATDPEAQSETDALAANIEGLEKAANEAANRTDDGVRMTAGPDGTMTLHVKVINESSAPQPATEPVIEDAEVIEETEPRAMATTMAEALAHLKWQPATKTMQYARSKRRGEPERPGRMLYFRPINDPNKVVGFAVDDLRALLRWDQIEKIRYHDWAPAAGDEKERLMISVRSDIKFVDTEPAVISFGDKRELDQPIRLCDLVELGPKRFAALAPDALFLLGVECEGADMQVYADDGRWKRFVRRLLPRKIVRVGSGIGKVTRLILRRKTAAVKARVNTKRPDRARMRWVRPELLEALLSPPVLVEMGYSPLKALLAIEGPPARDDRADEMDRLMRKVREVTRDPKPLALPAS